MMRCPAALTVIPGVRVVGMKELPFRNCFGIYRRTRLNGEDDGPRVEALNPKSQGDSTLMLAKTLGTTQSRCG